MTCFVRALSTLFACSLALHAISTITHSPPFAAAASAPPTTPPVALTTTTPTAQCDRVDLREHTSALLALNGAIDVALASGFLHQQLAALDPVTVHNERLETATLTLLGTAFRVTPLVEMLHVRGVANIQPLPVNVTSDTNAAVGAIVNDTLRLNGSLCLTVEQLHRKWWQPCYTRVSHIAGSCLPATLDVDVHVACVRPRATADVQIALLQCPRRSERDSDTCDSDRTDDTTTNNSNECERGSSTCRDITMRDVVAAVLRGRPHDVATRVLRRVQQLAVTNVRIDFDALAALDVQVHDATALSRACVHWLTTFSRERVNHRRTSYRMLVTHLGAFANASANAAIEQRIGDRSRATCVDSE